ncbi:MAG: TetR/AcrR family transcriptional regulator [Acidimicrobiia bacterium]
MARPASDGRTPTRTREMRARGRQTMRTLLDAGAEVFAERGYHAARVDDVVTRANTSHGTFYLYFGNKEELFRALAVDVAASIVELGEALPRITADASGRQRLREWLGRFAGLYERQQATLRAWTEAEIGDSEFGRLGDDVFAELSLVVATRVRGAAPDDVDPATAGLAVVAMIERLHYYVATGQVRINREEMLDTLTAVTHGALFGVSLDARSLPPARSRRYISPTNH